MSDAFFSALAEHFKPRQRPWATPLDAARALTPEKSKQTPALQLIDDFLMRAHSTPNFRGIISMPPQNGKSERVSKAYPAWTLSQNPDTRIVIASYQQQIAERITNELRISIKNNGEAGGLIIGGKDTEKEWRIRGYRGGVLAASVGGSLTSRSADLLIIDDPVKGLEEARSPTYQARAWRWWTATARTRVQNGGAVIIVLTRWHDQDLAGQLMANNPGEWEFLRIPAQADHRPELGETDPLGREPGEFMESVQEFDRKGWEQVKREVGPQTWAALYQGVPSPDEGGIFPAEWARYEQPLWEVQPNGARQVPGVGRADHELVQSWDLAFKGTDGSDYVVGQVWLRVGSRAYLLDMVRERMNFTQTLDAIRGLSAKWPQAHAKYVEDKANGPAVMSMLSGEIGGLIPVNPEGGKIARANAVSAYAHAGDILLPAPALLPNVGELLEELKLFPASSHDDSVDALTQAVSQLLLYRIDTGAEETFELFDDYTIAPYDY